MVSFLLVTSKPFVLCTSCTEDCIDDEVITCVDCCVIFVLIRLCNQRLLRFLRFRFSRNGDMVRFALYACSSQPHSCITHPCNYLFSNCSGKALVRLVMLGCICCQTSTCILSTLCSSTGLTNLCYERSHLMVGFALICFQRLSTWNTATGRLPLAG